MERGWATRGQGSGARDQDQASGTLGAGKRSLVDTVGRGHEEPHHAAPAAPAVQTVGKAAATSPTPTPAPTPTTLGEGAATSGALPRLNLYGKGKADAELGTRGDGAPATAPAKAATPAGAKAAVTPAVVTHTVRDAAPSGAANRTVVGVGEMITFESNVDGEWHASFAREGNTLNWTERTYEWYAPSVAQSGTVKFVPKDGGATVQTPIQVLAPQVSYRNPRVSTDSASSLTVGTGGAIMDTDVHYGPDTVSFANTAWWEEPGGPSGLTGYFRPLRAALNHSPAEDDLWMNATNGGVTDTAGIFGLPAPFSQGTFIWSIPTYYKVQDDDDRHLIRNIVQGFVMTPNGTMTVSKDGAVSAPRAPGGTATAAPTTPTARPSATPPAPAGAHGSGKHDGPAQHDNTAAKGPAAQHADAGAKHDGPAAQHGNTGAQHAGTAEQHANPGSGAAAGPSGGAASTSSSGAAAAAGGHDAPAAGSHDGGAAAKKKRDDDDVPNAAKREAASAGGRKGAQAGGRRNRPPLANVSPDGEFEDHEVEHEHEPDGGVEAEHASGKKKPR